MSTQASKNRKNLYLWIIFTILAVGFITGYLDGRGDKGDTIEAVIQQ
jgi:hypothetical protein